MAPEQLVFRENRYVLEGAPIALNAELLPPKTAASVLAVDVLDEDDDEFGTADEWEDTFKREMGGGGRGKKAPVLYIHKLEVPVALQAQGHGRRVVLQLLADAHARGAKQVWLYACWPHGDPVPFWKAMGFETVYTNRYGCAAMRRSTEGARSENPTFSGLGSRYPTSGEKGPRNGTRGIGAPMATKFDPQAVARDLKEALGVREARANAEQMAASARGAAKARWGAVAAELRGAEFQEYQAKPKAKPKAAAKAAPKGYVKVYGEHGKKVTVDVKARQKKLGLHVGDTIEGVGGNVRKAVVGFSPFGVEMRTTHYLQGKRAVAAEKGSGSDYTMPWGNAQQAVAERRFKHGGR